MLKPIPGLLAFLEESLSDTSLLARLDSEAAALLKKRLQPGDWAYVRIVDGLNVEIVKIVDIDGSTASLVRGIDDTQPQAFGVGTRVEYVVPIQATTDMINEVLASGVELKGAGAIKVTQTGPFAWEVHADRITVVSNDTDIEVVDMYPNIMISKK